MGDAGKRPLRVDFSPRLRLEFHGARLSSDGGLLAYRELDERLGLTAMADDLLVDTRHGLNTRHSLIGLVRQSIYARLAGYEDLNDAERLRVDPVFGQLVGGRAAEKGAASVSQMARFETEMLVSRGNLHGLEALNRAWVERAGRFTPRCDGAQWPARCVAPSTSTVKRSPTARCCPRIRRRSIAPAILPWPCRSPAPVYPSEHAADRSGLRRGEAARDRSRARSRRVDRGGGTADILPIVARKNATTA